VRDHDLAETAVNNYGYRDTRDRGSAQNGTGCSCNGD
jgi:hypothetical protein